MYAQYFHYDKLILCSNTIRKCFLLDTFFINNSKTMFINIYISKYDFSG